MPNLQFWTELFPNGSIEEGKEILGDLHWNIVVKQHSPDLWTVHGGHQLLLKTTVKEAVDALLYGMSLAYHGIPEHILDQLRRKLDRDAGLM